MNQTSDVLNVVAVQKAFSVHVFSRHVDVPQHLPDLDGQHGETHHHQCPVSRYADAGITISLDNGKICYVM